ncbi:MAG: hypothetical protein H7Z41_04525 [Cytophagales bacterium]|nr:hypothetical protein [Armatimonadota bacterium]
MAAMKLYLPYGALGSVSVQKQITFHWFRIEREEPLAAYETLLLGYKNLTPEARTKAEAMVDEFFSESEFHQLRDYLRQRHGEDLRTTVLMAPVNAVKPDLGTRAGSLRPFAQCASGPNGGSGFCRLSDEENYGLPFPVWGYYAAAIAPAHLTAAPIAAAKVEEEAEAV